MTIQNTFTFDTLLILLTAIGLGLITGFVYRMTTDIKSRSMTMTLSALPTLVVAVLAAVNGNLGVAIGIAGVFSLVRFRSVPGKAKDMLYVFLSMAIGVVLSTGNILFASCTAFATIAIIILLSIKKEAVLKTLRVTIPESLDYYGVFDEELKQYCSYYVIKRTKLKDMGATYEIDYTVQLKKPDKEKEFMDKLRIKNGNLSVSIGVHEDANLL